jgi:hypothetical protein
LSARPPALHCGRTPDDDKFALNLRGYVHIVNGRYRSRRPGGETWLVVAFPGWPGILRLRAGDDMTPFSGLKRYEGVVLILPVAGMGSPRGPACEAFTAHGFVER